MELLAFFVKLSSAGLMKAKDRLNQTLVLDVAEEIDTVIGKLEFAKRQAL